MKKMSKIAISLLGAALMLSGAVLAGNTNKGSLQLAEQVNVEGKSLNPGSYKVEWEGSGPTVQVSILQGRNTVATFPARVVESGTPNQENAYSTIANHDGSLTLTAIYLGGKRTSLQVENNQAASQSITTGGN